MNNYINLSSLLRTRPFAQATVNGNGAYPTIKGWVCFYKTRLGVIVASEIAGLPYSEEPCAEPIFAFHIHEGGSCSGNETDRFANAGSHYNPNECPHPYHAGDMPPLFSANGKAISLFLTDRFTIEEIIGKTVIIHSMPDDFTTQPSGNAGTKIACGVIKAY